MVLLYSLLFFARDYDRLLVETDCRLLLSCLSGPNRYTGSLRVDLERASDFLCLNGSSLQYYPRDANTPAHTLSQHGLRSAGVVTYASLTHLPCEVRGAIILDVSVPHLRA